LSVGENEHELKAITECTEQGLQGMVSRLSQEQKDIVVKLKEGAVTK